MGKKDFIALADAIRNHNLKGDHVNPFQADQIDTLADFCRRQNYNFKGERWVNYIAGKCGPNGGKAK